ncbi:MAG: hypothetical protein EAZ84_09680 [Verrucomicrobia bacterium]|nr:MAG: hypothetical protein EAZ84_09680 [Verrucomicrobiota bacterium]TAE86736.1 MAG: hypothetical protein EAZ82_10125 [Verrucomicrobiota bacterium]TAF24504.1 MAG: hypothetical protein EAZ71_10350 [Verrucomicrobiota bacterium]
MKLLGIRLHPFGGTKDRHVALQEGLNLLHGPNEFGKSTLTQALWHALFTPTKLPPERLKKTMGRWFPRPQGSHARVSVEFEAEGRTWNLQKCWGTGAASLLTPADGASISDPGVVQATLERLVRRNEATWRQVLFLNQAQLTRTIEELKANAGDIDDLQPLLAGAAAIPGDIPADKLVEAVDGRIAEHFSQWDRLAGGPKDGRGIDRPWVQKVGPLLAAYYAMETTRRALDEVKGYEIRVDRVHAGLREAEARFAVDRDFVATGRGLRDGLARREGLAERVTRLNGEQGQLRQVLVEWPGAEQVMDNTRVGIEQSASAIGELEQELANARKRAAAEELRAGHERLVKAREAWRTALSMLEATPAIPAEALRELRELAAESERLRIQIAAQKLSARLESRAEVSVDIGRGVDALERVVLPAGGEWAGQAEGKLRLEVGELSIEVASGSGDVQGLFSRLAENDARRKEILRGLNLEDLVAVEAAESRHRERVQEERAARQVHAAALQGKSEETWAAEIAGLDALPPTRAVAALEEERGRVLTRKAELEAGVRQVQEKVERWRREFGDLDALTSIIIDKAAALKEAESELGALPGLPDGFESVAAYLDVLRVREQRQAAAAQELETLKVEQAGLVAKTPLRTAEELGEELESREAEFRRHEEKGRALMRIRDKLAGIVAERGNVDPMAGLRASIARNFEALSGGRYVGVRLEGGAPVEVSGTVTLEAGLLSQGTLGSLALATRLSLAALYLKDAQGFMVLDDPFTDMDPARRRAAVEGLAEFSKGRQVLFFTCHPQHASELQELAGGQVAAFSAS